MVGFTLLFVLQMTLACIINTYFYVVPNTFLELLKLSILPFSIYNAVELVKEKNFDDGLLDSNLF